MKLKIMMLVLLAWLCFMQPVYADAYSCISDLTSDPDFQPIKSKVALGAISEQTFGMLANEATPTPMQLRPSPNGEQSESNALKVTHRRQIILTGKTL